MMDLKIIKRIENNAPNGLLGINIGPNKDTDRHAQ